MFPWDAPQLADKRFTTDGRWKLIAKPISKRWHEQLDRIQRARSKRIHVGMSVKLRYDSKIYQVWSNGPRPRYWWIIDEEGKYFLHHQSGLYIVKFTCQEA